MVADLGVVGSDITRVLFTIHQCQQGKKIEHQLHFDILGFSSKNVLSFKKNMVSKLICTSADSGKSFLLLANEACEKTEAK